jgi:hypothetical protein
MTRRSEVIVPIAALIAFAGCQAPPELAGQEPTLDGRYRITRLLCAGQAPESFVPGDLTWTLDGARALSESRGEDACVVRAEAEVSYPREGWIQFRVVAQSCDACAAESCPAPAEDAPAREYAYWVEGDAVTLAHLSDGAPDEPCGPGESVVLQATRQP